MMNGASTFGSNGIPYRVNKYDLIGQAESIEAFNESEINGTPLEILPVKNSGKQEDSLPLDIMIVNFPK